MKVHVFIDASNIWATQKTRGRMLDFAKLIPFLSNLYNATEIKTFYYTAYPANGTRSYTLDGKHRFLTYLKKELGFNVRKKELKRISVQTSEGFAIEEKGNMDVEMTIDAIHNLEAYDVAILFSGDSDFLSLVHYIKNNKKKVYVYSSRNNVSQELRTAGDGYVDILKITQDIWGKDLHHRA